MTNILDCLETIRASGFSMIEVVFSPAHLDYKNLSAVREAAKEPCERPPAPDPSATSCVAEESARFSAVATEAWFAAACTRLQESRSQ